MRPRNERQTLFQLVGVFQGDTLSPLIFLVAFNPLIKGTVHHLAGSVYSTHPPPTQGVSQKGIPLYTLWNEPQSEVPHGWYLAKVTYISDDGNAVILYKRSYIEETVNLLNVIQAKGNREWFFPISSSPPAVEASTPKSQKSSPYFVKGFADDLTIIF